MSANLTNSSESTKEPASSQLAIPRELSNENLNIVLDEAMIQVNFFPTDE